MRRLIAIAIALLGFAIGALIANRHRIEPDHVDQVLREVLNLDAGANAAELEP